MHPLFAAVRAMTKRKAFHPSVEFANMTKRAKISERMKIDALLWMCADNVVVGFGVTCHVCSQPIFPGQPIDWDHYKPLALGGSHSYENLMPLHRDCHRKKTRGTGATTAGSDIGKISKERRIIRTQKFAVHKPMDQADEALWSIGTAKPKRKFPKGRKLQSRGFEKAKR